MRERTDYIVVHTSATPAEFDIGVAEIRALHAGLRGTFMPEEGPWPGVECFGWSDVGYHLVIRRDGTTEPGRHINAGGAHAKGFNRSSIGICMAGGLDSRGRPDANYTRAQYKALEKNIGSLLTSSYVVNPAPVVAVVGHRDLPGVTKACPCFDVRAWWSNQ